MQTIRRELEVRETGGNCGKEIREFDTEESLRKSSKPAEREILKNNSTPRERDCLTKRSKHPARHQFC